METSFEKLKMQLGQISSQLALKLRSNGNLHENILDSPRDMEFEREVRQECEVFDERGVEETLTRFIKINQINFQKINRQKETLQWYTEASFENLAMQCGPVSSQLYLKFNSSGEFDRKILDSPKDMEIEIEFKQEYEIVDEGGIEKDKEEERCTPFDKEIEARIKEVELKIICGKRTRMQYEDYYFG